MKRYIFKLLIKREKKIYIFILFYLIKTFKEVK